MNGALAAPRAGSVQGAPGGTPGEGGGGSCEPTQEGSGRWVWLRRWQSPRHLAVQTGRAEALAPGARSPAVCGGRLLPALPHCPRGACHRQRGGVLGGAPAREETPGGTQVQDHRGHLPEHWVLKGQGCQPPSTLADAASTPPAPRWFPTVPMVLLPRPPPPSVAQEPHHYRSEPLLGVRSLRGARCPPSPRPASVSPMGVLTAPQFPSWIQSGSYWETGAGAGR